MQNQRTSRQSRPSSCKKKASETLQARCDSFVVETNVHYPTDINLLYDAVRKIIDLISKVSLEQEESNWRQYQYNKKHLKRSLRQVEKRKKSRQEDRIVEAHQEYLTICQNYLDKAEASKQALIASEKLSMIQHTRLIASEDFFNHAKRQIQQIQERVFEGKKIKHSEKEFSIFEPHTEWICKGKAGVPQELGLRVCVLEDQYQFLLYHQVKEKQGDEEVAVSMIKESQRSFPDLKSCSFDKGFHSPNNQEKLAEHLEKVVLPRKGKLSKEAREIQAESEFVKARKQHAAVESAINALEVHGLDRCPDHGMKGFKRYVSLAIVARNLQIIGAKLLEKEREQEKSRSSYKKRTAA